MKVINTLFLFSLVASVRVNATNHNINFGGSFGMNYSPSIVNAVVGDTVTWNGDFVFHPLASSSVPSGAAAFSYNGNNPAFSYFITTEGDYNFSCTLHGFQGIIQAAGTHSAVTPLSQNTSISVFPVVVRNFLKITLPATFPGLRVEIKNIVGQTNFSGQLIQSAVNTLDLTNLHDGIYFVAIYSDMDLVKVVRIIKE